MQPWSMADWIRFSDPITLFCQYKPGFCMLSPTWLSAAKCMTATGECFSKTWSMSPLFNRSPCSKGPNLTASLQPVTKLSKVTGIKPDCCSTLHAWEPMYPAPPVTKTFCSSISNLPILQQLLLFGLLA